jgi:hypothetical protein
MICLIHAILLWVGLAYSVGWYLGITKMGTKGWFLPSPETAAAYVGYRVSMPQLNSPYDEFWWFILVPCVGWAWVALQCITSPYFGGLAPGIMLTTRIFALATLPITALGPIVGYSVWTSERKMFWDELYLAMTRQGWVEPNPWLGPMYMGMAVVSLVLQGVVHYKVFGIRGPRALAHFALSLVLLMTVVAGAFALLQSDLLKLL